MAVSDIPGADGTGWFHPRRLTLNAQAVARLSAIRPSAGSA
jgi:hypothetical protein